MFRKLHRDNKNALTIFVDGEPTTAELGETVAAVLLRQREPWSRLAPVSGNRRAPYCMMGVCFECLAEVDGIASVQTCLQPVRDGMCVSRQTRTRKVGS